MILKFPHSNYLKGQMCSWSFCGGGGAHCYSPLQSTAPTSFPYVTHWAVQVFEFESSGLNHVLPSPKNLVLQNKTPTLKASQSFLKKHTPLKTNTENTEWFPDVLLLSEKMSPSTFKNCKLTAHKGNMKVTSMNIKIKQNCNMWKCQTLIKILEMSLNKRGLESHIVKPRYWGLYAHIFNT